MADSSTADLARIEIYKWLMETAEYKLNSESVARDTYVTVKGVDGTDNVGSVKNAFQAFSYFWGVSNTGIKSGNLSGGGPAFRDLYFITNYEKGVASAFQYMTQGKAIDQLVMTFLDQKTEEIGTITLEKDGNAGVLISDLQIVGLKSKDNRAKVIWGVSYAKITHKASGASGNYALGAGKGG